MSTIFRDKLPNNLNSIPNKDRSAPETKQKSDAAKIAEGSKSAYVFINRRYLTDCTYIGRIRLGADGKEIYTDKNGELIDNHKFHYFGEIVDGQKHGQGRLQFPPKSAIDYFIGNFVNNQPQSGCFFLRNGGSLDCYKLEDGKPVPNSLCTYKPRQDPCLKSISGPFDGNFNSRNIANISGEGSAEIILNGLPGYFYGIIKNNKLVSGDLFAADGHLVYSGEFNNNLPTLNGISLAPLATTINYNQQELNPRQFAQATNFIYSKDNLSTKEPIGTPLTQINLNLVSDLKHINPSDYCQVIGHTGHEAIYAKRDLAAGTLIGELTGVIEPGKLKQNGNRGFTLKNEELNHSLNTTTYSNELRFVTPLPNHDFINRLTRLNQEESTTSLPPRDIAPHLLCANLELVPLIDNQGNVRTLVYSKCQIKSGSLLGLDSKYFQGLADLPLYDRIQRPIGSCTLNKNGNPHAVQLERAPTLGSPEQASHWLDANSLVKAMQANLITYAQQIDELFQSWLQPEMMATLTLAEKAKIELIYQEYLEALNDKLSITQFQEKLKQATHKHQPNAQQQARKFINAINSAAEHYARKESIIRLNHGLIAAEWQAAPTAIANVL